jgi:hypothetical protein
MPNIEPKKQVHIWPVLRIYTRASLAHPWLLAVAFIGVVAAQAAGLITPLYLKQFINVLAVETGAMRWCTQRFLSLLPLRVCRSWVARPPYLRRRHSRHGVNGDGRAKRPGIF